MFLFVDAKVELKKTVNSLLHLFFPGHKITSSADEADAVISISTVDTGGQLVVRVNFTSDGVSKERVLKQRWVGETNKPNEAKRIVRLAIMQLLEQVTGETAGSWGTLTAVRPTKIVHRMLDLGWGFDKVRQVLENNYAVSGEKTELLCAVAKVQRPYLNKAPINGFNLYIGIPFCPSRCGYCSFPAVTLNKYTHLVDPYLDALCTEIRAVAQSARHYALALHTVYVGGGTPTSLSDNQLAKVLATVEECFGGGIVEYTVEAGRPDTLNEDILALLKNFAVNRISVNPQTMCEHTLERMGRKHSIAEFFEAFALARSVGFDIINTDLIAGLPGEDAAVMEDTVDKLVRLAPENVTLHTLAIKRASQLHQNADQFEFCSAKETELMLSRAREVLADKGYLPYYLYRQKNTLGRLENVGYALPRAECVYNVMMMEERETVIGVGVGSSSKWVKDGILIDATHNPRDVIVYMDRLSEFIGEKAQKCAAVGGMTNVD